MVKRQTSKFPCLATYSGLLAHAVRAKRPVRIAVSFIFISCGICLSQLDGIEALAHPVGDFQGLLGVHLVLSGEPGFLRSVFELHAESESGNLAARCSDQKLAQDGDCFLALVVAQLNYYRHMTSFVIVATDVAQQRRGGTWPLA